LSEAQTRAGFAAVVGAPNAGKSTLVNRLVGTKIAAVTHKAQTTRAPVRGVVMRGPAQVVLVDTPGIFDPRRRLDRAMVEAAWRGAGDADVVVVLIDAAHLAAKHRLPQDDHDVMRVLEGVRDLKVPAILVLNKVDAMAPPDLLALVGAFAKLGAFERVFMISALNGSGVDDLIDDLAARMPQGEWLYPPDQAADIPMRLLAAEITREKLFLRLHEELPYASSVETERWTENKDGSVRIDQIIFVERDGQKAIVLGKSGQTIKAIGADARRELEAMLERRVHLFLFVKVRERWSEDPAHYRDIGLEAPKE